MGYAGDSHMVAGLRSEDGTLQMPPQRYQGYPHGSNNQLWAEYDENPPLFNQ